MILVPKFIAGMKADVNNNIFFLNDSTVLYPAGHNIVIYNMDDKQQTRYIPGIEGSEGITALALNRNKTHLAVAEKTHKTPICSVYNLETMRRKIIVSNEITKQREFISIAFSPTDDKKLVTLTENAHDQQQIFIWQWDKAKCHTQQLVPNSGSNGWGTQVSFSNFDEKSLLVTGP